jgi:hypothetical protein
MSVLGRQDSFRKNQWIEKGISEKKKKRKKSYIYFFWFTIELFLSRYPPSYQYETTKTNA